MYNNHLEKGKFVYPNGFARGYPFWTENGLYLQKKIIDSFFSVFGQHFKLKQYYPPLIMEEEEYAKYYGNRRFKYTDIPCFTKEGERYVLITDALPISIRKLDAIEEYAITAQYSVIRLLNCKQKSFYRDFYIFPLVQINIHGESESLLTELILSLIKKFFEIINLPVIILEYQGKEGYADKFFMAAALDRSGTLQAILQCSLLNKSLLEQFGIKGRCKSGVTYDIGFSQKLLAIWADNCSDKRGFCIPSNISDINAIVYYNQQFSSHSELISGMDRKMLKAKKIYVSDKLGEIKVKGERKKYSNTGAAVLAVHRNTGREEFYSCFHRYSEKPDLITDNEGLIRYIEKNALLKDKSIYDSGMNKILSVIKNNKASISEMPGFGKVINL